ncbi:MAG: CBS domain-containing protein [Rhodospirillales bacterium]
MKISQIMSDAVEPIDPTTTIAATAKLMRDEDVGCLLIGRNDEVLGIVTDRDLAVRALADDRNALHDPVWTVMSAEVVSCFEDQSVAEAAAIMVRHGVRRLPVLDRTGLLAGIVSWSDVHGRESRKKSWQVTYYKELPDSRGMVHAVPLFRVHIGGVESEAAATAAARRLLAEDWCRSQWKYGADGCRVTAGTGSSPIELRRGPWLTRRVPASPTMASSARCAPCGVGAV